MCEASSEAANVITSHRTTKFRSVRCRHCEKTEVGLFVGHEHKDGCTFYCLECASRRSFYPCTACGQLVKDPVADHFFAQNKLTFGYFCHPCHTRADQPSDTLFRRYQTAGSFQYLLVCGHCWKPMASVAPKHPLFALSLQSVAMDVAHKRFSRFRRGFAVHLRLTRGHRWLNPQCPNRRCVVPNCTRQGYPLLFGRCGPHLRKPQKFCRYIEFLETWWLRELAYIVVCYLLEDRPFPKRLRRTTTKRQRQRRPRGRKALVRSRSCTLTPTLAKRHRLLLTTN